MNDYVILTDSSCDLPDDIVKKYQLEILQLDFIVEGEGSFHNDQADIEKVYSKLRNGANIKTSAANISQASEAIEALFNQKKDILYLGFSSGLSSTYQTVYMAGQELPGFFQWSIWHLQFHRDVEPRSAHTFSRAHHRMHRHPCGIYGTGTFGIQSMSGKRFRKKSGGECTVYRRNQVKAMPLVYSRRSFLLKKRRSYIRGDSNGWNDAFDQANPACR